MSTKPVFQEFLVNSSTTAPEILKAINKLQGCVYLTDKDAACIAFLPEHYIQFQQGELYHFKKVGFNQYHKSVSNDALTQLLPIANTGKATANSGFHGGYIGFVDYNFAANQLITSTATAQPQLYMGCYQSYLKLEQSQWVFYSHSPINEAMQLFEYIQQLLDQQHKHLSPSSTFQLVSPCQAVWSKAQYRQAFQRIQDYIRAGDCYQINLTQAFNAQATGDLLDTAEQFWQLTQAPYSGYLKLDDFELLSCSPELFIEFAEQGKLITKPIKGTMPRSTDPVLDQHYKQQLIDSKKDQAENLMIVDLLRNDLSVYAEIGSVKTPKLFEIESFNQVHHMVSEIHATLITGLNPLQLLLSALPGGSITGAPKIRAMQIIEELEAAPRGAYCGTLGYFNFDGTGAWNILIRSIQKYQQQLSIWAGGGITIASDCDAEYQECLDKVSAMLDLINTWQSEVHLAD